MAIKGTIQIPQLASKPSAPPVGSVIFYIKNDNIIYVQDSTGTEYSFASASLITDLHGDVVAHGPGDVPAAVVFVGGKSAADIAQSVNDTQAATAANTPSVIMKRDSSGNVFITQINGVVPEAHASRHLPNGADPLTTAAPSADLSATTTNAIGAANSLARSDHSHAVDTGTPSTQTPDQSNSTGSGSNLARASHVHNIPTAAPTADLTPNSSNAQGSASTFARSDHSHAIDSAIPVTQNADQSNAIGSAAAFAKSDHVHNIPTAVPTDIGAANAQGSASTFARSDHVHLGVRSVKANGGSERYNNLSLNSGVGVMVTDDGFGGFTIDVSGGASELHVSQGAGLVVNYTAGKVIINGVETFVAAGSISVLASMTGGYVYVDNSAIVQSAALLPPNAVPLAIFNSGLSSITFLEDARVFLSRNLVWGLTSDVQGLNASASSAAGSSEKYARADHAHAIATGVPVTQTPDQSNAAGSSSNLARADHVHDIPTAAPSSDLTPNTTNAQGSASSFSRSDHSHAIDSAAPVTQNADQSNGAGTAASFAKSDHVHNIPTDVPVSVGVANAQGSANKFAKSDHVHDHANQTSPTLHAVATPSANGFMSAADKTKLDAATDADTPLTIVKRDASGNISVTQINGVAPEAHATRHLPNGADPLTTAAPISDLTPNTTNAVGTANSLARSDHSHAVDSAAPVTQNADVSNTIGSAASFAKSDHVHNIPTDVPVTQTPDQANAQGSSTKFAKADHVHDVPSGVPVQIGTSNFQGSAPSFSLSDHVHNHGSQTSPTLHAVATPSANGFQSAADKAKSDAELPASLGTANQVLGVNNAGTAGEYKSLNGTANQVIITDSVGAKTFSTPQDIATTSQPTFAGENLTDRLQLTEQVAPATPAATKIDVFAELSNGFTRLRALDSTGIKSTLLRDSIILVKNTSGSTIGAGKGVYYTGADSGTNLPTIALAKADSSTTVPCIGLTIESITNGSVGRVIALGIVNNIDTSAFSQGDKLYLSATTAGALTNVKPSSPSNIWQRIGIVLVSNASTGAIEVRPFATHGEESGTNTGFTLNTFALTDAATITLDASKGNVFTVTLGGNRTLAAPTNPVDGQKITLRITQDGTGGRTLTFDSVFRFGLDILSVVLSSGAGKTDYVGCQYNSAASKWDVLAVSKGF